jgi:hypothetical protein
MCSKQLKATSSLFYHLKHCHKISIQNLLETEVETSERVGRNQSHSVQEGENQKIQSQEGPKEKRQKTIQDCVPP